MVTCHDVIVRTSKRRSGGRKSLGFFFAVVLLSCSLTAIGASGVTASTTNTTTARPEVDGAGAAWQSNPEVEFLKRFLVAIVREAMRGDGDTKDPALEEQDPERQLRVLMDEASELRGTLAKNLADGKEEEDEEEDGEKGEGAGPGATPGPAVAEVKKSATEVFRDHKLKTLFRWGKREP